MDEDFANMAPMQRSLESPAFRGVPINYQERRIWHFNEQVDRMIGVERIPPELRVEQLLRQVRRRLTSWPIGWRSSPTPRTTTAGRSTRTSGTRWTTCSSPTPPPTWGGRSTGARRSRRASARRGFEPLDDSQHLVATHQVRVDGDEATCRCYLQAQHVRAGVEGGDTFLFAGRYEDRFERTSDGWRIRHRTIVRMWTDGNPAVVRH